MHKRLITGAIVAATMLPAAAFAQTATVDVQIKALLDQIQALQLQLRTLIASSTANINVKIEGERVAPGQLGKMACIMLNRNLGPGSRGDDVKKLQEMLAEDRENGFNASATGVFGPMTARAMAKFQMRMGIAARSDGHVGPMTRGFFERACGKGLGGGMGDDDMRDKIRGEITATATSTITVKPESGDARVVNLTTSTTISIFATATSTPTIGSVADLTVGKKVAVAGTANADGSLTAVEIKVGVTPPPPPPMVQKIQKIFKFDHRGKKVKDSSDGE